MKADLSTDTLIQLMREVFTGETLDPESRTRIRARVTSNPSAQGMELWTSPAIPINELYIEAPTVEGGQLWLFPDFDAPSPPVESTMALLLDG